MDIELHKHQEDGVNFIIKNALSKNLNGFLLSDEPGLGKTYTAITTIKKLSEINFVTKNIQPTILVVCPLSVINHWKSSFYNIDPKITPTILNYHKLKQLFLKKDKSYILKEYFNYIIFDECHHMRNPKTLNFKLGSKLSENSFFSLFVSATPSQTPLEVAYLKPVLKFDKFYKWISQMNFATYKDQNLNKALKWISNPKDLETINTLLYKSNRALRRKASEIENWPELQLVTFPISINSQEQKRYNTSWDEFLLFRKKIGLKDYNEDVSNLIEVNHLKHSISRIKVPYTIELAMEQLKSGYQVAIYCEFLDVAESIYTSLKKYKSSLLTGEIKDVERYKVLEEFKYGTKKVIIFTISESINLEQPTNLSSPRFQINHDIPWSGIKATQVNGRCHRNGMHCVVYNMIVKNSVDEIVEQRLKVRLQSVSALSGDDFLKDALIL